MYYSVGVALPPFSVHLPSNRGLVGRRGYSMGDAKAASRDKPNWERGGGVAPIPSRAFSMVCQFRMTASNREVSKDQGEPLVSPRPWGQTSPVRPDTSCSHHSEGCLPEYHTNAKPHQKKLKEKLGTKLTNSYKGKKTLKRHTKKRKSLLPPR